jgi:hypothetical protein
MWRERKPEDRTESGNWNLGEEESGSPAEGSILKWGLAPRARGRQTPRQLLRVPIESEAYEG